MKKIFRFLRTQRKIVLATSLSLIVVFGSIAVLLALKPKGTLAVWFDDSYTYRQLFSFTHNANISSPRAVTFSLDTAELIAAGVMQSDCDDTRFTDINGKQLQFEITGTCNNAATTYEVVFPTVVNGTNSAYVYYGNPSAVNASRSVAGITALTPSGGDPAITDRAAEEKGTTPVLYWKFDEGYGTTATDATSYTNNGTETSTTVQPEDMCKVGKCLLFNGTSSKIVKTYSSDTELDPGTAGMSFSVWFRHPSAVSDIQTILDRFTTSGYKAYMNSSGNICLDISDASNNDSACTSSTYNDNNWHFLEGVRDTTNTKINIYIDGKLAKQSTLTATGSISGSSIALTVGASNAGAKFWNGFLDEVKVYNYAKSSTQILTDYANNGSNDQTGTVLSKDTAGTLSDGLVGYWKMDETSWTGNCSTTSVTDSSGNGKNGTACPNAAAPSTTNLSKFNNAGSFDGSDDYVSIASPILPTGDYTYSAWVNVTDNTDELLLGAQDGSGINEFLIAIGTCGTAGTLCVYDKNSLDVYTTRKIATNTWTHIVVTRKGDKITAYINTVESSLGGSTTGTNNATLNFGSCALLIGVDADSGCTGSLGNYYAGKMDDVRIYNRALSSSEVNTLYDWAPGPLGYWKFDENTGTSAYDSSGNGNTGTITNSPPWVPGKFGSAVKLASASTQYVDAGSVSVTGAMTVSAWIKPSLIGATMTVGARDGSTGNFGWNFRVTNGGFLRLFISGDGTTTGQADGATVFSTNTWYYVTGVFNPGSSIIVYVNGVQDGIGTTSIPSSIFVASQTMKIGSRIITGSIFDGTIDDFKIYNYARTPKQIIADMNASRPAVTSAVGSQITYWRFDEGYGTTANDASSNSKNGTISGASWTNSGKYSKAISVGTNTNSVSMGDVSFVDGLSQMAISMWLNPSTLATAKEILGKWTSGQTNFQVTTDNTTSSEIRVYISSNGATDTGSNYCTTSGLGLTTGAWQHLVINYDGSASSGTAIKIYNNGSPITCTVTGTIPSSLTSGTTSALKLGDYQANSTALLSSYDEFKMYDYSLSSDEVKIEYNRGKAIAMGALSTASDGITASTGQDRSYCVPGDTTSCSAPVGEWKFDEKTGTSAFDTSTNGITGTLTNGPLWASGKMGGSVSFDGSNDYVTMGDPASGALDFGNTSDITLEAWVYRSSTANNGTIFDKKGGTNSTSSGYMLLNWSPATDDGSICLYVSDGTNQYETCTQTNVISTNQWYHVVAVFDQDSATNTKIYINGIPNESATLGTIGNVGSLANATNFQLGRTGNSSTDMWPGKMDTVRVYNYALSKEQIAWAYNRGGPIGYWKFDECQGTTAYDSSGFGNNGTITPGGAPNTAAGSCNSNTASEMWSDGLDTTRGTSGKFNAGLGFDGTNDTVTVADTSILTPSTATISSWVRFNQLSSTKNSDQYIVDKTDPSSPFLSYLLRVPKATDKLGACFTNASRSVACADAPDTISTGTWYNVVGVYNGSNVKLYVNGSLVSTSGSFTGSILDSSGVLRISGDSNPSNFTDGTIDDVRIYNYPLTAVQIKTLYNEGAAVRFGPSTGQP